MAKRNRKRKEDNTNNAIKLQKLAIASVILQLVTALLEFLKELINWLNK